MPHALERCLEWWLDLPPTPPGQGTAWRLETGAAPGSLGAPPLLGWIAVVAIGLVVLVYWRDAARLSVPKRLGLVGLRLAVVGLLLVMLSRLSLRVDRTELPAVAVLVDVSASMGLTDHYRDRKLSTSAAQLAVDAPDAAADGVTRLQLAQSILIRRQQHWLRQLEQTHQVRLYAFDEHLRPLANPAATLSKDDTDADIAAAVSRLTPAGALTAPATAVRELLDESRGRSLSGIVLFTDGVSSVGDEDRVSVAAERARERGVPLYPVGVGSEESLRDVELFDLLAEDVIYAGDPVTLSVQLRSFGFVGKSTELRVDADGEDRALASRRVQLASDGAPQREELTFVPQREGEYRLTVTAVPLTGESDMDNNSVQRLITVRRDQFHVLLVEGAPRWEYRTLKPVLERDDTIQLETFLQEADLDFAPEDRTALGSLPSTREQWERYDAVLWGDVDLGELDRSVPERLRELVRSDGGGVIFIAGERHNPVEYAGTALEALLPVRLGPEVAAAAVEPADRFRLERTVEGRSWPLLRLADEATDDEAVWRSLPSEIDWFMPTPEVKPGAQVLATHSSAGINGARWPLIVHQRYGGGQVLYHGIDELWTWRKRVEDRYYGRYWSQAVRTIAAGRVRRGARGRELTSDRRSYQPGEEVHLRLRGVAPEESAIPEAAGSEQVRVESPGGTQTTISLAPRPGESNIWEGTAAGLPLGSHTATLLVDDPSTSSPRCTFLIERPNRELRDRKIARADLELAARISHGRYHSFADADAVPETLPRGRSVQLTQSRPVPVWNRGELFLLLVALISTEWILRRRSRLV